VLVLIFFVLGNSNARLLTRASNIAISPGSAHSKKRELVSFSRFMKSFGSILRIWIDKKCKLSKAGPVIAGGGDWAAEVVDGVYPHGPALWSSHG
jgi:hypothetical protein